MSSNDENSESFKRYDILEKLFEKTAVTKPTVIPNDGVENSNKGCMLEEFKSDIAELVYKSLDDSMYSIALLVHYIYETKYKVAKIKSKCWFVFDGIKWKQTELGPYYELSIDIVNIYLHFLQREMKNVMSESDETIKETIDTNIQKFNKIIDKLKNVNTKENICKECLYLFYDCDFMNKLDTNPHFVCFQNGILDLQENKFRKGYSDDFISLSIDMIFSTPTTKKYKHEMSIIIDNFQNFRRKIINIRKNKLIFTV